MACAASVVPLRAIPSSSFAVLNASPPEVFLFSAVSFAAVFSAWNVVLGITAGAVDSGVCLTGRRWICPFFSSAAAFPALTSASAVLALMGPWFRLSRLAGL